MLRNPAVTRPIPDAVTLEARAARAGLALACAFSSSAEFDAALIAERRAAGVYGPRRHRRQICVTATGIVAGLLVLAFFIL
ncbi:MAG: hypothetical protein WA792_13080 [Pseudolabrys sp.]